MPCGCGFLLRRVQECQGSLGICGQGGRDSVCCGGGSLHVGRVGKKGAGLKRQAISQNMESDSDATDSLRNRKKAVRMVFSRRKSFLHKTRLEISACFAVQNLYIWRIS